MLKVAFGILEEAIIDIDSHFIDVFDESWLDDDLVKQIIFDIDKSTVLSNKVIESPFLGGITHSELSGSVKTLICLYKGDGEFIYDLMTCGNNCEDWILKIGELKDIKVTMSASTLVFRGKSLNIFCINTNRMITSDKEWVLTMVTHRSDRLSIGDL